MELSQPPLPPTGFRHLTVLRDETLDLLAVRPGGRYCDGTLGGAGHGSAILEASSPDGILVGIDRDPQALAHATAALAPFGARARLKRGNFSELLTRQLDVETDSEEAEAFDSDFAEPFDGLIFDLGVSSHQLDRAERGFSFRDEGPLDMRMDPDAELNALSLIMESDELELRDILWRYGEEKQSRRVAVAIKEDAEKGTLKTTRDLAELLERLFPQRGPRRIHPATRTFQALRIAVNDELGSLERLLAQLPRLLKDGGRVVIISFHSLEDRLVKRAFARLASPCTCPPDFPHCICNLEPQLAVLTKRPVTASDAELERNPRSRSAKLRAARRVGP
jgi:16S rRNA (cytosine1402-N4)-methyltransferase